ncbi:hypothetical protein [Paenibacillus hamazuiensis]|uniref:hypothetical protein n=1 Tax=Paenibacillus hamazuiensis TaxID=2936508 RepID=UPI00200E9CB7|nr:hypothetical protein [Paenibacillus hamazuiensis]
MRYEKGPRTGEIAALLLAIWIGLLALCASHIWSVADPYRANLLLLKLGSWLPGWWGIGPYAGKETAGLAAWLASWLVLHVAMGRSRPRLAPWIYAFTIGFALLLVAIWPPVYHAVFGWLPTAP